MEALRERILSYESCAQVVSHELLDRGFLGIEDGVKGIERRLEGLEIG